MKSPIKPNDWFCAYPPGILSPFPCPVYLCTAVTSDGYIYNGSGDYYNPTSVRKVDPDEVAYTLADIHMALQLATILIEESDSTGYDLLQECMIELTYHKGKCQ